MTAAIVGWSHLPFGRHDNETVETMTVRAARDALAHAGIAAADVDEIVLGHFNAGFSEQDFTASLVLQADDALRFKRATRVENACATGYVGYSLYQLLGLAVGITQLLFPLHQLWITITLQDKLLATSDLKQETLAFLDLCLAAAPCGRSSRSAATHPRLLQAVGR